MFTNKRHYWSYWYGIKIDTHLSQSWDQVKLNDVGEIWHLHIDSISKMETSYSACPYKGRQTKIWTFQSCKVIENPRYLIVVSQTDEANNTWRNPIAFDHIDNLNILLTLNAHYWPNERISLNFEKDDYADASQAYTDLYSIQNILFWLTRHLKRIKISLYRMMFLYLGIHTVISSPSLHIFIDRYYPKTWKQSTFWRTEYQNWNFPLITLS